MEKKGGYRKTIILFNLLPQTKRYNELKRSHSNDYRKGVGTTVKTIPPYVTYELSKSGKAWPPVLYAMNYQKHFTGKG